MNLYELQSKLITRRTVSVPELQAWLSMSYKEALEVVTGLQEMGWLSLEPMGCRYVVQKSYCQLRPFRRKELDALFDELDSDCRAALNCITENRGALYQDILTAVRGEDDTDEALAKLTKHKLVYSYRERWFLAVSSKVSEALQRMIRRKRVLDSPSKSLLLQLFEGVFDD